MPFTVGQGFSRLKSNLEITSAQSAGVSTTQSNVREVINAGLDISSDFLTGSYQRNTMIAPLKTADVDIFFVLYSKYFQTYQTNPAGLLDKVRDVLLKTYTRTPAISRNGQAVTIRFDDFTVDVVPGFSREGGGYLIPNSSTASWISTDPKVHVQIWSTENTAHNGDLVPLIKMLKCWNRENGELLTSFHLECLILKVLKGVGISSYQSAVQYFFNHARSMIDVPCADPAGYSGNVGQYLNTYDKKEAVKARLQRGYDNAYQASQFEAQDQISNAYSRWKQVFGDWFPNYG
jgi:hypothetical protein